MNQILKMAIKADVLKKIFYDVSNPASFSSSDRLFRAAKKIDNSIKISDVNDFLKGEITYTLHRRVVRKFKRNPVIARYFADHCQADLVDIQRYSQENDGNTFILTVIDVFTKYAYAVAIKNKTADSLTYAFESIFKKYKPGNLQTDEGKEFTNQKVQKIFKDYRVHWFVAKNEVTKASVVERFQRTLMTKVHKYMTSKGTHSFTNILEKFLDSYNNAYHRTIRMSPIDALKAPDTVLFKNIYGFPDERSLLRQIYSEPKVQEGSMVRIQEQKNRFAKGYLQNFTDATYEVTKSLPGSRRATYHLSDYEGNSIKGSFYPEEIQSVKNSDRYRINVIGERYRGRRKQYLVHYVNFPDSEDQWIPASQVENIS